MSKWNVTTTDVALSEAQESVKVIAHEGYTRKTTNDVNDQRKLFVKAEKQLMKDISSSTPNAFRTAVESIYPIWRDYIAHERVVTNIFWDLFSEWEIDCTRKQVVHAP